MASSPVLSSLLLCLSLPHLIRAITITEYAQPSDCPDGMFYDISHLKCDTCPGENTAPSVDKLSCVCQEGFRRVTDYGGIDTKCEACPTSQVPTPDGWQCASCVRPQIGNQTTSAASRLSKTCPNTCDLGGRWNSISLSRNVTGYAYPNNTCAPCQPGTTIAFSTKTGLQYCEACNTGTDGGNCPCPSGEQSGGLCFDRGKLIASVSEAFTVGFEPNDRVISAYFQEHLRAAEYMCKTHKNFTACQLLGNLCVLLHYENHDSTRSGRSDKACDYYANIASVNSIPNPWPPWMPFLSYVQEDNLAVLTKPDFDVTLSFAPEDAMSALNFTAAVYSLNGTFVGLQPLTGGLLQMCAAELPVLNAAYRFGRKYRQTCQISLKSLLDKKDILFYDIYLVYPSRQDKSAMYPIPILNENFLYNNDRVNQGSDRSRWQFFRRIFLADSISSKERDSAPSAGAGGASPTASPTAGVGPGPKYLRYAQYIGIFVKLKDSKDGKIYPPFIRIRYADIKLDSSNDPRSGAMVSVEFEVSYSMDTTRHEKDIEITMSTLCSFGALWALLKAWSWSRRSGKAAVDFQTIFKFVIFLASTISNIFLIVLVFMCAWMLILYKRQRTPIMMMLTPDQEYSFLVYLGMAMALKSIELINMIAEQVTTNIFFVDWERPRGYIIPRVGESNAEQPPTDVVGSEPGPGKTLSPVTIWRTYMVANEWNEFQTYRKTSYVLQLFAMIFFLKIVNLENLALIEPGATVWNAPKEYQYSRMSRFAVAAVTYLLFGFFQWFVNVFIIERCIVDHFRNFIDLCSISNMSVFVLQYRQYGYYIHGRSVHGHADTNMREMNEMLQRERENLCTQRGLEPNTEHQCFVASFSHKFRDQYDRMLGVLKSPNRPESRMAAADQTTAQVDRQIEVYTQMNQFLSAFIDHLLPDINYVVKDRLFLESLLDMEFHDSSQIATFHRDPSDAAFARVFFYGNEWTLLTFDALLFCIVDLISHNFLIAAFVTYLIATVIRRFRALGGKKNIIRSCLIDERFLI